MLDGLEGDTRIYCRDANNIARVEEGHYILVSPEKEPSNIIIIHIGLTV